MNLLILINPYKCEGIQPKIFDFNIRLKKQTKKWFGEKFLFVNSQGFLFFFGGGEGQNIHKIYTLALFFLIAIQWYITIFSSRYEKKITSEDIFQFSIKKRL